MDQEQNSADSSISPEYLDAVRKGLDAKMTAKGNGNGNDGACELTITAGYYPQAEYSCDEQDCPFTIKHDKRDLRIETQRGFIVVPGRSVVSIGLEFLGMASLVGIGTYLLGPPVIAFVGLGSLFKSGKN